MSDSLPVSEYGDFLKREYLDSFVAEGGAAVKVAIKAAGCYTSLVLLQATLARLSQAHIDSNRARFCDRQAGQRCRRGHERCSLADV